jgi:phage shock protein PspC (stress-responsive transcriptional regulator)
MNYSDELNRLADLHARGVLNDEEFARAKAKVLDGQAAGAAPAAGPARSTAAGSGNIVNDLRRARLDRWIGGVCGGIAEVTGLESWIWRLIFTVVTLFGGAGLLIYILLWIFVPEE